MATGIDVKYITKSTFKIVNVNMTDVLIEDINIKADCGVDGLKYGIVNRSEWITPSAANPSTKVFLKAKKSDDLTSNLTHIWYQAHPHMDDGRPIVRSDTRPLNGETYFTSSGDSDTGIGDGLEMKWDFSNDNNDYTGSEVPSGFKAKKFITKYVCPIHIKDGAIYFKNAVFGSYITLDIYVPSGSYYPNPEGAYDASDLGLEGKQKYSYAGKDKKFQRYVNKHFIMGDCTMGDELNAEGCSINALPIGWYLVGLVIVPDTDDNSQGFASFEMYRCHTTLLPGQNVNNIHD